MNDLITVKKLAEWEKLKALVLDSVSSPITRRVYNMALNEFMNWYVQSPRPGFCKATVSAWRASLEARQLGSSSIIIRMSAIRKLAGEAVDNGLLAPELAAGIARVKSVKSVGIRTGNWLSLRQAQALLTAPDTTSLKAFATARLSLSCSAAVCVDLRLPRSSSDIPNSVMAAGALSISRGSTDEFVLLPSRPGSRWRSMGGPPRGE